MTWVPWSSRRLAAATGYGAGVRAPGWYHHLFTHAGPDVVARWFCEVAAVLRAGGYTVSPAQLIDATRLADALATMRRRTLPGLSEVTDAAAAVLGEGGSAPMALVHEELIVGTTVGSVPDDTPMVPLARDLAASQRRLRLKPEDRTLELDLRRPGGLARSHLLHRLALLDVPWGIPLEGRGAAGTFRETWRLRWEPELSVRLVERSAYGTTVEAAAAAYIAHLADGGAAWPTLTPGRAMPPRRSARGARPPCGRSADRAAVHAEVAHLMDALGPLARARRYGDVRGTDVAALRHRAPRARRAHLAGLGPACTGLDDDAAAARGSGSRPPSRRSRCSTSRPAGAPWFRALADCSGRRPFHGLVQVGRGGCCSTPAAGRRPRPGGGSAGRSRPAHRRRGRGVRRGVPRRQWHRPRCTTATARPCRRLGRLAADRRLRRPLPAAATDVRRVRARRAPPDRRAGAPRRAPGAADGSATISTRPVPAPALATVRRSRLAPGRTTVPMTRRGRVSEAERLRRWRLVLGGGDADGTGALGGDDRRHRRRPRRPLRRRARGRRAAARRQAGSAALARRWPAGWATSAAISRRSVVQVMQRDAIERLDLTRLLLEPEMLAALQPDLHLVTLLARAQPGLLPDETRATARRVIATVLSELEDRLADRTARPSSGALRRHLPHPPPPTG